MHRRERPGVWLGSLSERRNTLTQLQQRRTEVLDKLNSLLEVHHVALQQDVQRAMAQQELDQLQEVTDQKQRELAKVRDLAESQLQSNQSRRLNITSRNAQLGTARMSVAPLVLPQELRTHEMAVLHAWLGLLAEQRLKMSQLLEILPLRVEGMRSSPAPSTSQVPALHIPPTSATSSTASSPRFGRPGALMQGQGAGTVHGLGPGLASPSQALHAAGNMAALPVMAVGAISVSLCGFRLPDSLAGVQTPQATQALCAALGYALLLMDLAAAYLSAPLLHEGSFQGSTSVVWQQQSFWNRRPAGSNCVLPLFLEPGLVAAAVAPLSGISSKSKSANISGWGGLPLMRAMTAPSTQTSAASNAARAGGAQQASDGDAGTMLSPLDAVPGENKHVDLRLAFEMLQRSCMCMVRHCAATISQAHDRSTHQSTSGAAFPYRGAAGPYQSYDSSRTGGSPAAHLGTRAGASAHRGLGPGFGLPLPYSWNAWGCLVALCAALLQDDADAPQPTSAAARLGGVLQTASQAVQAEAISMQAAAWQQLPSQTSYGAVGSASEEPADEEGWDVVHSVLPPPPSSEDVEQYARALFTDGNTSSRSITSGNVQGGSMAPQAVSALTRALSRGGRVMGGLVSSNSLTGNTGTGPGSPSLSASGEALQGQLSASAPHSSSPLSSTVSILGSMTQVPRTATPK